MNRTVALVDTLRKEGFRVSSSHVAHLLRERAIPSSTRVSVGALAWPTAGVGPLRRELARRGQASGGKPNA